MTSDKQKSGFENSREHLANERTFLAWIRTSVALMGFGFVIVKFVLFLKQISMLLESKAAPMYGHSAIVGVIMVALGVILALLAFVQYKKTQRQLNQGIYDSSPLLTIFITLVILISGIFLVFYLWSNII
ncbi:MAG: DUF202 domain-containing protein [Saprospiraceae bacterium]|nr:DUF202 domain-containing protein [Saprospiraceae bacterium]